jgi:hypothetical protein
MNLTQQRFKGRPTDAETLAKTFKSTKPDRVADTLETLAALSEVRVLPDGQFVAA